MGPGPNCALCQAPVKTGGLGQAQLGQAWARPTAWANGQAAWAWLRLAIGLGQANGLGQAISAGEADGLGQAIGQGQWLGLWAPVPWAMGAMGLEKIHSLSTHNSQKIIQN